MHNAQTFNIGNAHTFNFRDDGHGTPYLWLAGPRVHCYEPNICGNAWATEASGLSLGRFDDDKHLDRRQKALAIIKHACPGKEF